MASRTGWWITGGLAVALAAALPLVLRAALQPVPQRIVPALPAAGASFAAICKDDVVEDSRADPAWVLASYEGDNCLGAVMPVALDGRTATRAQIMAGMAAVKLHAARSQAFERCVADFVALRKTRGDTPAGKSFLLVETHRILASEKNRKQAAARMAAAINAFNEYGSECAEE
jgi:hypothetical protein